MVTFNEKPRSIFTYRLTTCLCFVCFEVIFATWIGILLKGNALSYDYTPLLVWEFALLTS